MRVTRDRSGRRRVWYDEAEIEQIAEEALASGGLMPGSPQPIDIEELLENHLEVAVDYSTPLPDDVLALVTFEEPIRVMVNRSLTEAAVVAGAPLAALGRWRATLAHEAAHVLLHSSLYRRSGGQVPERCLRSVIDTGAPSHDWREVQANMGMAALLMPRALYAQAAKSILMPMQPVIPPLSPDGAQAVRLVSRLARQFVVSRQAASIRLATLGFVGASH